MSDIKTKRGGRPTPLAFMCFSSSPICFSVISSKRTAAWGLEGRASLDRMSASKLKTELTKLQARHDRELAKRDEQIADLQRRLEKLKPEEPEEVDDWGTPIKNYASSRIAEPIKRDTGESEPVAKVAPPVPAPPVIPLKAQPPPPKPPLGCFTGKRD